VVREAWPEMTYSRTTGHGQRIKRNSTPRTTSIPATAIAAATSSSPIRSLTCRVLGLLLFYEELYVLWEVVEVKDAVASRAIAVHAAIVPENQSAVHDFHFVLHAPSGILPMEKTLMSSI